MKVLTLEQRVAALQCLMQAKQILGLPAEDFAVWLAEEATLIAPQVFEAMGDEDEEPEHLHS